MEAVLLSLAQCFIVFGIPVIAVVVFFKVSDRKDKEAARKKADAEYLEKYGQGAYEQMLKVRASAPPMNVAVGSANEGIWYSKCPPEKLIKLIQMNNQQALIGTPPYRLTTFFADLQAQTVTMTGSWPNPKNPEFNTYLELTLSLKMQTDTRTQIIYKYVAEPPDDPFAKQAVMLTSHWLKPFCEGAV